jgi:hypothetical protein
MSMNGSTGRDDNRDDVVVRKAENGWVVGDEKVSDLTSAMVLADLFAADQGAEDGTGVLEAVSPAGLRQQVNQLNDDSSVPARTNESGRRAADGRLVSANRKARLVSANGKAAHDVPARQTPASVRDTGKEVDEAARLAVTVAQLEHALATRVRVEQAIGVLAERHRLRPREAFDLLRGAARSRGRRITEMAQEVVSSAANPLLRLPEELARKLPEPRQRGRSLRRARHAEQV